MELSRIAGSVDVRGLVCSEPVLMVRIGLRKIQEGDVLEVFADTTSGNDILRIFGKVLGYRIAEVRTENGSCTILIEKPEER